MEDFLKNNIDRIDVTAREREEKILKERLEAISEMAGLNPEAAESELLPRE